MPEVIISIQGHPLSAGVLLTLAAVAIQGSDKAGQYNNLQQEHHTVRVEYSGNERASAMLGQIRSLLRILFDVSGEEFEGLPYRLEVFPACPGGTVVGQ